MISDGEGLHARTDFFDDSGSLVTENRGKKTFRVVATQGEGIGMAYTRCGKPHQAFTFLRTFELDFIDFERLPSLDGDGSFDLHDVPLVLWRVVACFDFGRTGSLGERMPDRLMRLGEYTNLARDGARRMAGPARSFKRALRCADWLPVARKEQS
jgi:hypothetical protein